MKILLSINVIHILSITLAVAVVAGSGSYVTLTNVNTLSLRLRSLYDDSVLPLSLAAQASEDCHEMELAACRTLTAEGNQRQLAVERLKQFQHSSERHVAAYASTLTLDRRPAVQELLRKYGALEDHTTREQQALDIVQQAFAAVQRSLDPMFELLRQESAREAVAIYDRDLTPQFGAIQENLAVLKHLQLERAQFTKKEGQALGQKAYRETWTVVLLSLLCGIGVGIALVRSISWRVQQLNAAMRIAAAGDYGHRVGRISHDAIGSLAESFNSLIARLEQSQRELKVSAEVADAATRAGRALQFLGVIVDSSDDAIIGKTVDLIITSWNKGAERLYGYSADEMIGKNVASIVPEECRDELIQLMRKLVEGQRLEPQETTRICKDGRRIDVSVAYSPIHDGSGKIFGISAIAHDVTERNKHNEELKQAKIDAEMANVAKSEFLANMSHEIRTPLNGIIGLTGLALDTELTTEQQEYLHGVQLSSESLLTVINAILDFSKVEAGKMELEQIDFDLRETLGNALRTLAVRAHAKQLELLYEVRWDVPDALNGDPSRLWQVLINLVSNALKFTEQGEISVLVELADELPADALAATAVENGSDASGGHKLTNLAQPDDFVWLRFTVSDTGIGIPADRHEKMFQPFTQVDSSMTRKYGGSGLGLAISEHLVRLMGGRIWFESEVGSGSQFHFTGRFARQTALAPEESTRPPAEVNGKRVLVVDDNSTNRRIQTDLLTQWGIFVVQAESGRAALETLRASVESHQPFDLILLDVVMPEMDGFEVLTLIHAMPEIDRPTILMLSSADQLGQMAQFQNLGAAGYLIKPIPPAEMLRAIVVALGIKTPQTEMRAMVARNKPVELRGRPLRILVAEDNAINQLLAKRTLEKAGHSVVVANNGVEAVAAVNRETFDLVLMDVQMPLMDGFQATARIRDQEHDHARRLPIVALTAHALKGDQQRCLAGGMDGYVSKPIRNSELFSAIAAAMNDDEGTPQTASVEASVTLPAQKDDQPPHQPF